MSISEEIYEKVVRVLAESLYVDKGDLTPTATLQGDLGVESLDFLEIVFRLENEFGIDIPDSELFPRSVFQGTPDFVREGHVTRSRHERVTIVHALRGPRGLRSRSTDE
jgi:acyl carrier protein